MHQCETLLLDRYHRIMISKVKPLHKKVEETALAIDNAEHKMNVLENKRKVVHVPFEYNRTKLIL